MTGVQTCALPICSVGDAYDNAMCESFFAILECELLGNASYWGMRAAGKCELLGRRRFASQAEARMACFSFIKGRHNPIRLHSSLGYRSTMAYEAAPASANV